MAEQRAAPTLKSLELPPIQVEVTVSPDRLQSMISRVEENFRHMGETEPHWSVLTADHYKAENIEATEEQFFASGRNPVRQLLSALARAGLDTASFTSCLEFGCGVGRSTIWLAESLRSVTAVDISAPHLRLATEACRKWERGNVRFMRFERVNSLFEAPAFDLFFSLIVLQHNPPPVIHAILSAAFRRLPPGGVAYFQVPTYKQRYSFDAEAYLATPVRLGVAEMHVLPQPALHDLIAECGCRLVEMREDGAAPGFNISSRLLVRKL